MPSKDLLNSSVKQTRIISIQNSDMTIVILKKEVVPRKHSFLMSKASNIYSVHLFHAFIFKNLFHKNPKIPQDFNDLRSR